MRKLYALLLALIIFTSAQAQTGELQGKVIDEGNGQGMSFIAVAVFQNGAIKHSTMTDNDGNYSIKPIQPGTYSVKAQSVSYNPVEVSNVIISSDKIAFQNIKMGKVTNVIKEIKITAERPLVDPDHTSTEDTKTKTEIQQLATNRNNPNDIIGTAAGVFQSDNGASLNVGGNRDYNNKYYVDGIPMRGNISLPSSAIEQLTIVTGGIPAKYGDATGGIINITTRGPSHSYNGGMELATSQFLDAYGYKLANANLSGPLFSKNRKTDSADTRIGFFLSGEYEGSKDRDPSAVGMWRVKDDVLADLRAHPLQPAETGGSFVERAQYVTKDDLEKIKYKQNFNDNNYRFTSKFDFKLSNFMNLTIGGTTDLQKRNEDYGNAVGQGYAYHLFSPEHSELVHENTYRGFIRFTQRFASNANKENAGATVFQNAYYSIQADYSKFYQTFQDKQLGTNPFHYGYYGKFKTYRTKTYSHTTVRTPTYNPDGTPTGDTVNVTSNYFSGYQDTLITFAPSDINPELAAYSTDYYTLAGHTLIDGVYGFDGNRGYDSSLANLTYFNGNLPGDVYSLFRPTGYSTGEIRKINNSQYRLAFSGSVDLVRPSSLNKGEKSRHALEFGFEYEQRDDRGWRVFPTSGNSGLWGLARQLANTHINTPDINNPKFVYLIDGTSRDTFLTQYMPNPVGLTFLDTVQYDYNIDPAQVEYFATQLRNKTGDPLNQWVDVNNLDPEMLSLDMFTPDELFNAGNSFVQYWGYDWKGNIAKKQPDFFDFWDSEVEENGTKINDRPIGSFRPIYTAAYLQDKFNFKDIIFNIGLRVDRYDANQKVLKDLYSLVPIRSVSDVSTLDGKSITHPGNIGNDYAVYVNSAQNPTDIVGYRDPTTNKWYDAAGVEIADPRVLAQSTSGGKLLPYVQEGYDPAHVDTKSRSLEAGFKDYDPQWSIMPRLAFSFPISDEALFFAHYDVLTQRPSNNRTSPYTYYYWLENSTTRVNNANLKPEKTIDYQVGFQQALGKNSAITLSGQYKELKNMVQVIKLLYAVPVDYTTYGNIDFGTVKSFQASYEMRRTNNIRLEVNYTLQFAEGTGSDQTSALNLVNSGSPNLRAIVPFDYDQRHTMTATVDYRYGEGSNYTGPIWGKKQIFKNTGLNTIFRMGSGTPYSRQTRPTAEAQYGAVSQTSLRGNINGSRKPFTFKIDARLDRDFVLTTKKNAVTGEPQKSVYLNAYLLVENLLNTKNVIGVYKYSGSATDDGFLSSAEGDQALKTQTNVNSYTDLYNIKVLDPDNFQMPRRIRFGLSINF